MVLHMSRMSTLYPRNQCIQLVSFLKTRISGWSVISFYLLHFSRIGIWQYHATLVWWTSRNMLFFSSWGRCFLMQDRAHKPSSSKKAPTCPRSFPCWWSWQRERISQEWFCVSSLMVDWLVLSKVHQHGCYLSNKSYRNADKYLSQRTSNCCYAITAKATIKHLSSLTWWFLLQLHLGLYSCQPSHQFRTFTFQSSRSSFRLISSLNIRSGWRT